MRPTPRPRLSSEEVSAFLRENPGWRLEQGELRRTFEFKSFTDSLKFVSDVGALAEGESHHPDIDVRYRRVTISFVTYDADGVTGMDTKLAQRVDTLRKALPAIEVEVR